MAEKLKAGDVIESAKVVKGAENLVEPKIAKGTSEQKLEPTEPDTSESAPATQDAEEAVEPQAVESAS